MAKNRELPIKKLFSCLIVFVILICTVSFSVIASDNNPTSTYINLKDGPEPAERLAGAVTISNDYLTMTIYSDGNFKGTNAIGECIFFPGPTSDLTIKIGSLEYNIRGTLSNYRTKDTYINPNNDKEAITEWVLPEGIHVEQHIKLEGDHVAFTVKARNNENFNQDVSVRYLWDTQLCDNDGSPLKAKGTIYIKEMCFEPIGFDHWCAYSRPEESEAKLVTYGWWADMPDKMIFAHWPSAIGSVYSYNWDPNRQFYTPGYVSSPESDSCVLMYWENMNLPANGEKSVTSYYGTTRQAGLTLSMSLNKDEYDSNGIMRISVCVEDADSNTVFPITKDNTVVRIDGNEVNIKNILTYSNGWYSIIVRAPTEYGTHNVKVEVVTDQGTAASDLKSFNVFEPFTFVHITDVHMGWSEEIFILGPIAITITSKRILSAAIDKINEINPDFILDTGDIAEKGSMYDAYWAYRDALDSLNDIKIYTVSGNHDWYNFWYGIGNLKNYEDIIIPTRPSDYDPLISPDDHNNYYFEHKSYLFVGLDTGWDVGGPLFQGSGLSTKQIEGLHNINPELKEKRKIIFMHHPAINGLWPTAGHWCIKNNRLNFIDYCFNNEVSLVLTGHTHEDKVFNIVGEREYWNLWGSTLWPLFVQTPSLTKEEATHGYRKITIRSESIEQKLEWLGTYPSFLFSVASPVTLHAYDSQGRHTGINFTTGAAERNIPRSFYYSNYTFEIINEVNETVNVSVPVTIMLYNVSQDYSIKIVANLTEEQKASPATEHFNFTVERQTTKGSLTLLFYDNISLFENTTAILPFNLTTTNYTLEIDYNGNGTIDEKKSPDATKIDYAPTAEIISPVNNSTYLFGEEIAFNGTGIDPEDGVLTNNSLIWFSDIEGIIGIGNEFNNSNLSVGRHNITLRVNETLDQMNTSTVSIFIRSIQPDMFIDILKADETPGIEQHINVIETLADQLCNLRVYINNTGYGTLDNVQILTNVGVTKEVGDINEGESRQVPIEFTPTIPGLSALNVTVKADEIERNASRALLVQKFDFTVSIPKTQYDQNEPVTINISVTNEVPNMRFIDAKIEINISNSNFNHTFKIPLLSLGPMVTKNTTFTWDTTGVNNGAYTIVTSLVIAEQEVLSDEKNVYIGTEPPIANANGPYTGVIEYIAVPITFDGTGSYDPDGTITSYAWDLDNDGEFDDAVGATPTVSFTAPGSGNIHLKVTDNNGATNTDSTTLTITKQSPPPDGIHGGLLTPPEQPQYYCGTSTIQGKGNFTIDERIQDWATAIDTSEHIEGTGEFEMDSKTVLDQAANPLDFYDPNFYHKKTMQFQGNATNRLISRDKFESSGIFGGTGTRINEYFDVSAIQKDESSSIKTISAPGSGQSHRFATMDDFSGIWGIRSDWQKICQKEIAHRQFFAGNFSVQKDLTFEREIIAP